MSMLSECDKPRCSSTSSKKYRGPNGNVLNVCDSCYWELVTGKATFGFSSKEQEITQTEESDEPVDLSRSSPLWHGILHPDTGEPIGTVGSRY